MKKKYFKYSIYAIVGIILISVVYFNVFADDSHEKIDAMSKFATAEVIKGEIKVSASGTGNVASNLRKDVKASANSTVDNVFVVEGQFVNEGDLIITLENDSENADIELSN